MRPTIRYTQPPTKLAAARSTRARRHERAGTRSLSRLTAALLLLVVLSVPPALLLALTGNPLDPPTTLQTLDALRQPLDDRAVVYILAVAAWLAWLHLLGCLLTEILQQLRGSRIRTPLPGLLFGANAVLASHLIAALLMSSSGSSLTPAPAASTLVGTVAFERGPLANLHGTDVPSAHSQAATAPLQRQEPSATGSTAAPPASAPEQGTRISCRVLPPDGRHHDTLWDIAERHLGDGMRWRDIYALNEGRLMPDGQRLTRASLIRPGWILHLPSDAKALTIDHVLEPAEVAPSENTAPSTPPRTPSGTPATRDVPSNDLPPDGLPTQEIAPATEPQEAGVPPSPAGSDNEPAPPTTSAHEPEPESTTATVAGLGTLLLGAAALLAALTRRRKIATRRRPPGVRPTRPAPELLEAERQLRLDARTAEDIAATLRLALLVAANEQDMQVRAVWEHPDGTLELVLPDHDPAIAAPAPFETTSRGWRLTPEGQRYLFTIRINGLRRQDRSARLDDKLQASPDPFPALLPVGVQDGSACLINLEPLGLVSLDVSTDTGSDSSTGPATGDSSVPALEVIDTRTAIVAAWAQGLAGAPWAELTDLYVPAAWAHLVTGLANAHSLDLITSDTTADATLNVPGGPRPASRPTEQYAPVASLQDARRAGIGGADSLRVAVSLGYTNQQIPNWLAAAAADPLDPNIVVLLGPHPGAHGWTLAPDETVSIPGIADRLTPLRLDTHDHDLLLRLLEHAEDPPHADPDDAARADLLAQCPPLSPRLSPPLNPAVDASPQPVGGLGFDDQQPDTDAPTARQFAPEPSTSAEQSGTATDEPDLVIDLTTGPSPLPPVGKPTQEQPAAPTHESGAAAVEPTGDAGQGPADAAQDQPTDESSDTADLLPPGPVEVRVLGPLEVHGAAGQAPRKQALDVLVHLAMHRRRPIPSDELFEAVWPSSGYNSRTLRNRVSEVRGYIPPGVDFTRGGYQLPDLVQTDWQRFQALAQGDAHAQRCALQLVRGRPFEGSTLDWMHLEGHFAEMEAAIVDLALDVGQRALLAQQYDLAREACYAGLRGCPYDERLYRIGMEAAAAVGATAEVRELRRRLEMILEEEVDDDIQPATDELYRRLETEDELRARRQQRHA